MQLLPYALPRQIVVATDLTDLDTLVPHVIAQAKATGAHVTLLHAIAPCDCTHPGANSNVPDTLLKTAQMIEACGVACDAVVLCGLPGEIICRVIERTSATRLLIGAHCHGHAGPLMLGAVTNSVLKDVKIPVFVIGPVACHPVDATPKKILHPVSLKGKYRDHASIALEIARLYNAELTLLHVMPFYLRKSSYARTLEAQAERALRELVSPDHAGVRTVVVPGELVQEILAAAVIEKPDWIVMGIEHDFPFWSKSNNAAYQVLADAKCPVLTLRRDIHETQEQCARDFAKAANSRFASIAF